MIIGERFLVFFEVRVMFVWMFEFKIDFFLGGIVLLFIKYLNCVVRVL